MPLRNRSAQADSARAQFDERQQRVQYRQLENTIVIDVRNAMIALAAGSLAGSGGGKSTKPGAANVRRRAEEISAGIFNVLSSGLRSRDLTSAQGTGYAHKQTWRRRW